MIKKIQQYGTILKRETLATATLSYKPKVLVLTSNDPFPGFYCSEEIPADNSCKENSFYLPIDIQPEEDDYLCRISTNIQEKKKLTVCPGHIIFNGAYSAAIRVKEIREEQLIDVIDFFSDKGIKFHKHQEIKSFLSRINLKNFFELSEITNGIFQNQNSENLYYFLIPEELKWTLFEKLITYQKSSTGFKNFDAAIGYWMQKPQFIDFVRIYGKQLSNDQLKGIRDNFIKNLQAYKEKSILI